MRPPAATAACPGSCTDGPVHWRVSQSTLIELNLYSSFTWSRDMLRRKIAFQSSIGAFKIEMSLKKATFHKRPKSSEQNLAHRRQILSDCSSQGLADSGLRPCHADMIRQPDWLVSPWRAKNVIRSWLHCAELSRVARRPRDRFQLRLRFVCAAFLRQTETIRATAEVSPHPQAACTCLLGC